MKNRKIKLLAVTLLTMLLVPLPALAATDPCNSTTTQKSLQTCVQQNPVTHDINLIVNFLSAGVGLVVIIMILVGGIQYIAAGDNAQAVTSAKQRITNAFIALVVYIFIFAFLQWLIPGGLFNSS